MTPKRGRALLFFPSFAHDKADPRTLHEAEPAVDEKWVAQQWCALLAQNALFLLLERPGFCACVCRDMCSGLVRNCLQSNELQKAGLAKYRRACDVWHAVFCGPSATRPRV